MRKVYCDCCAERDKDGPDVPYQAGVFQDVCYECIDVLQKNPPREADLYELASDLDVLCYCAVREQG